MPKTIAIAIEGSDADRALDEFLSLPGIQGRSIHRSEHDGVERDAGLLAAIGAVVGIVGGVAQVVSSIIEWRERWKKAHETTRLSVVLEDAKGNRLELDRATPEQITRALQTLGD